MAKKVTVLVSIVAALWLSMRGSAQSPGGDQPRFEVASVKPNVSSDQGGSFGSRPGGQLVVTNNTLRNIVRNAYQLQNFQIVGGPDWFDRDRFDISARATPDPSPEQFRQMVQRLLADRFSLVVHRETREQQVYALMLARSDGRLGPQLTRSPVDCAAIAEAARRGNPPPPAPSGSRPLCGTRTLPGRILGGGVGMADLARNVANFAGRMTVDKTGLAGAFDFEVEYTPDQLPQPGTLPAGLPAPPTDGPSLFTALQEQLGLKLESQRGPVDVLVIDSAARPLPD